MIAAIALVRSAMAADTPATEPLATPARQPTTAATAPAQLLQEWDSRQYRVRLHCPATWTLLAPPPAGQVFAARIPLHAAAVPFAVINLRIDRAAPAAPASESSARIADRAAMMEVADAMAAYVFNNGGKKVTIQPATLGDAGLPSGAMPARQVRFVTDLPSGPLTTMHVIAVRDGIAYVWTIAAPATVFDPLLPQVEQALARFETLQ
jgi:hypothetical protein